MIKIRTDSDIAALQRNWGNDLCALIKNRLRILDKIAFPCACPPNTSCFLAGLGEINFAQAYEEIQGVVFECVWKETLRHTSVFIALHVTNNDYCIEYIIPCSILTPEQTNALEEEC